MFIMIDNPIEMLIGMHTLRNWRAVIDTEDEDIGIKKKGSKKDIEMYLRALFDGHFFVP